MASATLALQEPGRRWRGSLLKPFIANVVTNSIPGCGPMLFFVIWPLIQEVKMDEGQDIAGDWAT